jgi:hypothetical protein
MALEARPTLSDRGGINAVRPRRPPTGRIQTMLRRQFIVADKPLTTPELVRLIYPRQTQDWHYRQVRRAARRFAVEVARRRSRGFPILWALR